MGTESEPVRVSETQAARAGLRDPPACLCHSSAGFFMCSFSSHQFSSWRLDLLFWPLHDLVLNETCGIKKKKIPRNGLLVGSASPCSMTQWALSLGKG